MNEGSVSLVCASLLADELARAGVSAVCISPGSRSTPLVLAFARDPRFETFLHLDERASAFFALGRARATGVPVAVVCTSGTAAANFFPAVIEASMARVPIILLTADRPPEVRHTGANQTIDQVELYGRYVRAFIEPPVPSLDNGSYWRAAGARAAVGAMGPPAGPVQVNCAFREPLIPDGSTPEMEIPPARIERSVAPAADVGDVPTLIEHAERGVIVAGGLTDGGEDVVELADVLGWPLIAEPLSGARIPGGVALSSGQALLMDDAFARAHEPDVVLQFGATPVTRATLAFVARARDLVVVDPDGWPADPARAATRVIRADARALLDAVRAREATAWNKDWTEADAAARAAIDRALDAIEEPFEGRIARDFAASLPSGTTMVVGSSMPVRDLDMYMAPRAGVRVLANRGASGIDGFVSTTLGTASAGPTYALCGDLTFLHDIGSLIWSARRGFDATFVVLNNNGGGVFDLLPSAALEENEAFFVTPHGMTDLREVAEAAGARYTRIGRSRELPEVLDSPQGIHVIDVPIDRARALGHRAEITRAVCAALG